MTPITADGAYDGGPTYETIATYGDDIEAVIPPRSTAVAGDEPGPIAQRVRHLEMITEQGRLAWQAATGYGRRSPKSWRTSATREFAARFSGLVGSTTPSHSSGTDQSSSDAY